MTITLNWTPALATCPDCGDEHDCVARVTCPVCNYHCGGELAQQWIDFCETLEFPDFLEIGEFSEPEGGRGSVQVESKHTLDAEEEKEFREWIAEVGEAEEGDVPRSGVGSIPSQRLTSGGGREDKTMTTTIDYCEGIHEPSGLPVTAYREIRTELPEGYLECPQEDQEAVLSALHRYDVARAEAISRINRAGRDGSTEVAEAEDADAMFAAAQDDVDTCVRTYTGAAQEMESMPEINAT